MTHLLRRLDTIHENLTAINKSLCTNSRFCKIITALELEEFFNRYVNTGGVGVEREVGRGGMTAPISIYSEKQRESLKI